MKAIEKLMGIMKTKIPVLLLGAGFSLGAKNENGEDLPRGGELSEFLFEKMYRGNKNFDDEYICKVEIEKNNLKKLCSLIRSENRVEDRDKLIASKLKVGDLQTTIFQEKLISYPWEVIFTLNIDNLVENIYKKHKIVVDIWDSDERGRRENRQNPLLVKLHGCVNKIEKGFVFDDDEYQEFTIEQNYLLKEFANQFMKNDVIILGTEFQESDLKFLLNLYEKAGYDNSGYNYFFISPQINDLVLKNKIILHKNFYYIEMTTEQFLSYMESSVSVPKEVRSKLKQHGVTFIDEYSNKTQCYDSKIYNGANSCYEDFFDGWDILYLYSENIIEEIVKSKQHYIISITGKQYSGKTCVAKRLLVDFRKKGFESFEIQRMENFLTIEIREYFKTIPEGSKVAIFLDNSAFQYDAIVTLVKEAPENISQVVVISADIQDNYHSKRYILEEHDYVKLIEVKEKINSDLANRIYEKLLEKNRLGEYLELLPSKQDIQSYTSKKTIVKKIKEINDLIDALYYSSKGELFKEYYKNWLRNNHNEIYEKYIYALCFLGKLGVTSIPVQLVSGLIPEYKKKFRMEDFQKNYKEIIIIENGRLVLRRRRMIQDLIKEDIISITSVLFNLLLEIKGLFTEFERNVYYEIFQKISRVKKINKLGISTRNVYEMFQKLENEYKNFSYFWIQYGIAAQILEDYESATNHLNYAKHLRPEAFSVKHALAKNKMQIALRNLKDSSKNAIKDFEEGELEMILLIDSKKHINNYFYSVHTYVKSLLLYSEILDSELSQERYEIIHINLTKIANGEFDSYMRELILKYVEHCKKYNCDTKFFENLQRLPYFKINKKTTEDDYETDLID